MKSFLKELLKKFLDQSLDEFQIPKAFRGSISIKIFGELSEGKRLSEMHPWMTIEKKS